MTILKDGNEIAYLPDKPQNFDAGSKRGILSIAINGEDVILAKYPTQQQACQVLHDLCQSYLHGHETFNLP